MHLQIHIQPLNLVTCIAYMCYQILICFTCKNSHECKNVKINEIKTLTKKIKYIPNEMNLKIL